MNDWSEGLGRSHRQRDESAADESRARQDHERTRDAAAHLRWPKLVAEIRTLARRYNEGAGREVLTVVDDADGDGDALAVTLVAPGEQTLRVAVSGAELSVRATPSAAGAADDGQRWITFDATDETIAAYALQDWLNRLEPRGEKVV